MATAAAPVDLGPLLAPSSIAVVGASADEAKPGGRTLAFLQRCGYRGRIYPINPGRSQIAGLPALASLEELPEPVDLVIFAVAAALVPDGLEQAGRAGARSAIIFSSGFREAGPEGADLERGLVEIARRHGITVLGPNCLGYVDVESRVSATFTVALQAQASLCLGPIGFISQSGAMGAAIFGLAQSEQIGLAFFVSTGNEAMVSVIDVLSHVAHDERLSVLLGYIEGVNDGRALVDAVRAARGAGKDVVLLKVGTTDVGRRAAASHTGAMAGSAQAWEAAFRRAGVLTARSPRDLLDLGCALAAPARPAGDRLGIVSMSGGAGALMADRAAQLGLAVPELGLNCRTKLARALPSFAALANPVDYGGAYGDPQAIIAAVRAVAEAPEIDMSVVFAGLSPGLAGVIEEPLARIAQETNKPLVVAWLGGPAEGLRALRALGVPAYEDPVRAVEIAAALRDSARPLPAAPPLPGTQPALRERLQDHGRRGLAEREVKALLRERGVPVSVERRARSADEAGAIGARFARPLAVKADAPGLLHKSDVGAVMLDVPPTLAAWAYEQVAAAAARAGHPAEGALLAPMAAAGVELLVGARWDEQFGPLIVVGAGGVTSEVLRDLQVELAPVDERLAREMLSRLRIAPLLGGFRGAPAADVGAAASAIAAISQLAAEAGDALAELDVNPLRVYPEGQGCAVLDAVAVVGAA